VRALLLVALIAACGGRAATPAKPEELPEPPIPQAPAGTDRAVIEKETLVLEAIADKACACKDVPCFEAVDALRIEYLRTSTQNDVMTDLETWPPDLDARGRRAAFRSSMCASQLGYTMRHTGVVLLREITELRVRACACTDRPCAERVRARMVEILEENEKAELDEPTTQELDHLSSELRACLAGAGERR
jgi:hypothetical protein